MFDINYISQDLDKLQSINENIYRQCEDVQSILEGLKSKIDDLNQTLVQNKYLIKDKGIRTFENEINPDSLRFHFPRTYRTDVKVKWILKNHFQKGTKIAEISEVLNAYNNMPVKIDNVVRRLRRDGVLGLVKYNKSNKLGFWGLSEWIDENGFKDGFVPSGSDLPLVIKTVEVIKRKAPKGA